MQRKTNLFYTKGNDSNFLTFSNFTEALTGNFLSTDWKVYPSRFLCLYIPSLDPDNENYNENNKENFIKNHLVAYYENKLAFLRDYYTENLFNEYKNVLEKFDIEADINALAWLLYTIYKFEPNTEINFIGEVTEFDYNGTYTDTICIIDSSEGYFDDTKEDIATWKLMHIDNLSNEEADNILSGKSVPYLESIYGDDETTYPENVHLYNWTEEELEQSQDYSNLSPVYDYRENYFIYSEFGIKRVKSERKDIRFNVIIPLFDITNINANTNFNTIDELFSVEENINFKFFDYDDETDEMTSRYIKYDEETGEFTFSDDYLGNTKEVRSVNNPMGIWFADECITLKRSGSSKYAPSWSLTISSQFKPFPYSDAYLNNNITSTDNKQAFATYAQVLSKQTNVSNNIDKLMLRLNNLEQIVSKLNNLDSKEAEERLKEATLTFEEKINNLIDTIPTIVNNRVVAKIEEYLKWK